MGPNLPTSEQRSFSKDRRFLLHNVFIFVAITVSSLLRKFLYIVRVRGVRSSRRGIHCPFVFLLALFVSVINKARAFVYYFFSLPIVFFLTRYLFVIGNLTVGKQWVQIIKVSYQSDLIKTKVSFKPLKPVNPPLRIN